MKKSRPALQAKAQEECGVWLDTVQLKEKKKKKRLAQTISKLLNPFVKGGGYNVAVALNFTQTKMEMPKTKQSSISSFFTRQSKDVPVVSGTKRKRGFQLEEHDAKCCLNLEWKREIVSESEGPVLQKLDETNILPFQNALSCQPEKKHFEESNLPQSKRHFVETNSQFPDDSCVSSDARSHNINSTQSDTNFIDTSSFPGDSQPPPQAWSQDPLFTLTQYTESEFTQSSQKTNHSEITLPGEDTFELQINGRKKTSTQNSLTPSSFYLEDEKENSRCLSSCHLPFSQNQTLSTQELLKSKTVSAGKQTINPLEESVVPSPMSLFRKRTLSSSPLKKQGKRQQSRCEDENSLSALFTQDSEGLRVIAHRQWQPRSPLKESNASTRAVRKCVQSTLLAEEDEMLFTQDSQGNMVIKH